MKSIEIAVSGEVQNKGFRFCTMYAANTLSIKGYVRNNIRNKLFITLEGEEERLDQFIGWSRNGLLSSSFSDIGINETTVKGYQTFYIVHNNDLNDKPGKYSPMLNRANLLKRMIRKFLFPPKNHHSDEFCDSKMW